MAYHAWVLQTEPCGLASVVKWIAGQHTAGEYLKKDRERSVLCTGQLTLLNALVAPEVTDNQD